MTEAFISSTYRKTALAIVIFGFVGIFIPFENLNLEEKVKLFIFVNLKYHLFYYLIQFLLRKTEIKIFPASMDNNFLLMLSFLIIACAFFFMYSILETAISLKEYHEIYNTFVPFGLFLAALKVYVKVRNIKNNTI